MECFITLGTPSLALYKLVYRSGLICSWGTDYSKLVTKHGIKMEPTYPNTNRLFWKVKGPGPRFAFTMYFFFQEVNFGDFYRLISVNRAQCRGHRLSRESVALAAGSLWLEASSLGPGGWLCFPNKSCLVGERIWFINTVTTELAQHSTQFIDPFSAPPIQPQGTWTCNTRHNRVKAFEFESLKLCHSSSVTGGYDSDVTVAPFIHGQSLTLDWWAICYTYSKVSMH